MPAATAFVTTCFGFHLVPKSVDGGKSVRVIAIAHFVSHSLSSHLELFSYLPFSSHLIVSDHLSAHPPIVPYRIMPFNRFPSISRCLLLHWTAHFGVTVDFFAASCPAITVHHGHRKQPASSDAMPPRSFVSLFATIWYPQEEVNGSHFR